MADDLDGTRRPPMAVADDGGRLAVAAHLLLNDVATVRAAVQLALTGDRDDLSDLLGLAARRLDAMTEFCRDLIGQRYPLAFGSDVHAHPSVVPLVDGTVVELYSAFNDTWAAGFAIVAPVDGGYRIRRVSDGTVLPGYTSVADLRVRTDRAKR